MLIVGKPHQITAYIDIKGKDTRMKISILGMLSLHQQLEINCAVPIKKKDANSDIDGKPSNQRDFKKSRL